MLSTIFSSIFTDSSNIDLLNFIICLAASLGIGAFLSWACSFKVKTSKTLTAMMAVLPAAVCVVIMMVNGNIGAGVAVAGAFSLVRFRSAPGNAKDIVTIFLEMGAGLICGMGYLAYAGLFVLIIGIVMMVINYRVISKSGVDKELRITIPEDLDYNGIFDEVFEEYTSEHESISVKTANMGSLYKLKYHIVMKDAAKEKEMIDALRCRNGNLEISISNKEMAVNEL